MPTSLFFIAGLLRDYNSALDNYFTLLKSEPIDLIGNYALGLQMDCVEEAGAPDYLVKPIIHKVMCEKGTGRFLQKLTGCSKFCQSSLLTIEIKKPIEDFFAKHDSEKMPYAYFNKLIEVVLKGNDGFLNYVFSVLLEDVVHVKNCHRNLCFYWAF
ncbi:MAG: hypothetical protein HWD59_03070 [Coxiellaceae bacterium]|nr:MAG: hypothetical protein HWD59_03070 [Coxiellaceae bacterium]